ncbi:type II toxin-antitoxin system RelE/ParE family toxin [Pseudothauera nasutitermitis]|uniref:type II toxin-antitoxin system RelE/ParE family toxin n=1 Tax=Pseudothauera nasutitermitis TaxID=2565930 RepID=UPI001E4AA348|nr:type II toxin-antitoxin system RelE/ParE family toxin [Pseudothauera nasutitermitis]
MKNLPRAAALDGLHTDGCGGSGSARKQWGDAQVRSYITRLKQGIERLVAGEGAFKDMSAIHPALRMAHCGHHYVFCLPREGRPR